jgi:hypothetical protein
MPMHFFRIVKDEKAIADMFEGRNNDVKENDEVFISWSANNDLNNAKSAEANVRSGGDEVLVRLASIIAQSQCKVRLCFYACNFSESGVVTLANAIKQNTALKGFTISDTNPGCRTMKGREALDIAVVQSAAPLPCNWDGMPMSDDVQMKRREFQQQASRLSEFPPLPVVAVIQDVVSSEESALVVALTKLEISEKSAAICAPLMIGAGINTLEKLKYVKDVKAKCKEFGLNDVEQNVLLDYSQMKQHASSDSKLPDEVSVNVSSAGNEANS